MKLVELKVMVGIFLPDHENQAYGMFINELSVVSACDEWHQIPEYLNDACSLATEDAPLTQKKVNRVKNWDMSIREIDFDKPGEDEIDHAHTVFRPYTVTVYVEDDVVI